MDSKHAEANQPPPGYVTASQPGQYPPAQGGNPPPQGNYPPPQAGYPPPQGAYPPPQGAYPPPQGAYPPPQGAYPPPQGGPPQGYAPQPGTTVVVTQPGPTRFNANPTQMSCMYCNQQIVTATSNSVGTMNWIGVGVVCAVGLAWWVTIAL